MLIPSDITSKYKFIHAPERGKAEHFKSVELSAGNEPLWKIEVCQNHQEGGSDVKILKHEIRNRAWFYKVKFDGTLIGPHQLRELFVWLKIL